MGYSVQEIDSFTWKLVAGTIDAAAVSGGQTGWEGAPLAFTPAVLSQNVLTQYTSIPPATTLAIAQTNAAAAPTLIWDKSLAANAVRLYAVTGTGGTTYVATASNSTSSNYLSEAQRLRNWISPARVTTGAQMSAGYTLKLYTGNPASGGTLIAIGDSNDGIAPNIRPGWIFNYEQGILLLSQAFLTAHPSWTATSGFSNFYILAFRYIGNTLVETLANIGNGGGSYTLPVATASILGGVKAGAGVTIAADGTLSSASGAAQVQSDWNAVSGLGVILNKPTLFSGSYTDLTNKPTIPTVPTAVSAFTNDSGYQTAANVTTAIAGKANTSSLATVATTGSYTDLTNKPTIPAAQVQSDWNAAIGLGVILNKPTLPTVPTVVSAFTNDSGYQTSSQVSTSITTAILGKANTSSLSTVSTTGSYTDLLNKPTLPVVPTNVSAFTNDAGYQTSVQVIANVDAAVATETTNRQAADAALQAQITSSVALEGLFVIGVEPTNTGIVGGQTYAANTAPANKVVLTCSSDTANIRVTVGIDGSSKSYSPTVTIAGVTATVLETSTFRWFTAVADIVIGAGTSTVTVTSNTGATTSFSITLAGAGPNLLTATIGAYPNSQTALKAGDIVPVTITTEASATSVSLLAVGASSVTTNYAVSNGAVVCLVTIGSSSGAQTLTFKAKNSFGTFGNTFTTVTLNLDQTTPTFGALTVAYPASKNALATGDSATVSCTVTGASSVAYSATGLTVTTPATYAVSKTVSLSSTGYVDSGTNYLITASKASNGTTATKNGLINIATTAPTVAITTSPTGRMVGSPTGINYTVTITSTQNLNAAPSLTASAGAWSGNWSGSGKVWTRLLTIADTTPKGSAFFSALTITNQALIGGSAISSGTTYTVGGFSSRVLTFAAFSRVTAIGASILDPVKTTCQIVGGNVLTVYPDNTVRTNGYYPANSDGSYNSTGDYIGLSDATFAGSNTSGTLQISVAEVA